MSPRPKARAGDAAENGNRRGSPDVVEKRRAARLFNDVLSRGGALGRPDGRTERRRKRLLDELKEGAMRNGQRELKPIDILSRVQELLDLGEPLASIKKACPPPKPLEATDALVDGIRRLHRAYRFAVEAYRFVGVDQATLRKAGVVKSVKPGLAEGRVRESPKRGRVA